MANSLKDLEHALRPISIFDKISAKFFKSPNLDQPCEIFNQWLSDFLSNNPAVENIDEYRMVLKDNKGQQAEFWVSNYPYAYGKKQKLRINHPHRNKEPNWENILKLRAIQLSHRQSVIDKYKKEILTAKCL